MVEVDYIFRIKKDDLCSDMWKNSAETFQPEYFQKKTSRDFVFEGKIFTF